MPRQPPAVIAPAASSMAPTAPTAAASVGVARPNMIAPSTDRISIVSGKKDFASIVINTRVLTLPSPLGNGGARCGLNIPTPKN